MRNRVHIIESKYKVIPDKGIVVCILKCTTGVINTDAWVYTDYRWWKKLLPNVNSMGEFTVRAKSICGKDDKFDEVIGKRIAESRAKTKAYKTAYKFWFICAKNIGAIVKFCNSTVNACSTAFCKEAEHVKDLCK